MDACVFCQIVRGDAPAHKIWEDDAHLAILSIYPNTPGFTVVITKQHRSSYAFQQSDDVLTALVLAAKRVAKLLDTRLPDVGRTGMILEGFGVDHLHAKLIPMHGTKMTTWRAIVSTAGKYSVSYEGYLSSQDGERADDATLADLARRIRGSD